MRSIEAVIYPAFLIVAVAPFFRAAPADAADVESGSKSGSIAVHVVGDDGKARTGAVAELFAYERDWQCAKSTGKIARSDSEGRVEFDGLEFGLNYVQVRSADGQVGYRDIKLLEESPHVDVNVKIEPARRMTVTVCDAKGDRVVGATLWALTLVGANGENEFDWSMMTSLDPPATASDAKGELHLPLLPTGTIKVVVFHPDFAPLELKSIAVEDGKTIEAQLAAGVPVKIEIARAEGLPPVEEISLDFRHVPFENPSTLLGPLPGLNSDGTAEFTVEPGDYEWARLKHPAYVVAPIYSQRYGRTIGDPMEWMKLGEGDASFKFWVLPKTKVRGRVVDTESGKPLAGQYVVSNVRSPPNDGPFAKFAGEWSYCEGAETNDQGEYELVAAPGKCQIEFSGDGLAEPWRFDVDVAADGSTVVPDFRVRSMPTIHGLVLDKSGHPVPGAVVRFRGSMLTMAMTPVQTDAAGRFEIDPTWIPVDLNTKVQIPLQTLVAFHPTEALHGSVPVNLIDAAGDVEIRLEKRSPLTLITEFDGDVTEKQRQGIEGVGPIDRPENSLTDKPAPELDGAHWLNTDGQSKSLADYHGKYVLLQFWATWCGPCHRDIPTLKLLQELYGDRGLVIIGVHDNSMPLEAIEADVAKNGLTYPIAVDQADGRIFAEYRSHGMSGYPSYFLVGPDGLVVRDDDATSAPNLRTFLIESVREQLLRRESSQ